MRKVASLSGPLSRFFLTPAGSPISIQNPLLEEAVKLSVMKGQFNFCSREIDFTGVSKLGADPGGMMMPGIFAWIANRIMGRSMQEYYQQDGMFTYSDGDFDPHKGMGEILGGQGDFLKSMGVKMPGNRSSSTEIKQLVGMSMLYLQQHFILTNTMTAHSLLGGEGFADGLLFCSDVGGAYETLGSRSAGVITLDSLLSMNALNTGLVHLHKDLPDSASRLMIKFSKENYESGMEFEEAKFNAAKRVFKALQLAEAPVEEAARTTIMATESLPSLQLIPENWKAQLQFGPEPIAGILASRYSQVKGVFQSSRHAEIGGKHREMGLKPEIAEAALKEGRASGQSEVAQARQALQGAHESHAAAFVDTVKGEL